MIRNILVLTGAGEALVTAYYGDCHAFDGDSSMLGNLVSAIHSFGKMLSGKQVNEIRLGRLRFYMTSHADLVFAMAVDDDEVNHEANLQRVISLFIERYKSKLTSGIDTIKSTDFSTFPQILIEQNIADMNCGQTETCEGCENQGKQFPVNEIADSVFDLVGLE